MIKKRSTNISPIDQMVIDRVRQFRMERNLQQHDLAAILGCNRTFIANVETPRHRAKYNLTHLNALAFYFGISPADFLPERGIDPDFQIPSYKKRADRKGKTAISGAFNLPTAGTQYNVSRVGIE